MELMPDLDNTCHRCEQTVYPVERIDIGLVYHKGCFKCHTCALQLNLKTYHLDKRSENGGEIYCQNHMPRLGVANIDVDAVGIQTALSAPPARWSIFGGQVRASMYEAQSTDPAAPATTADEQNDDSNAESATLLTPSGRKTMTRYPTLKTYKDFEDHGIFEAQRELERKQKEEEDSLFKKFHLQKEERMRKLVEEIMAEKETSVKELVALFDRLGMKSPSRIIKGTPLVWKGAPKSAADDAGADDDNDDDDVITEDLNLDDEASEGDTSATSLLEKSKHIDDEYQSRLDERMQELMRSLEQQEQEELAKLVEKHSKEMLSLIAEKERAIDTENDFNRSLPPDVAPPEVKKMDLFEKSDSAVQRLDMQAIEVAKSDDLTTFTDLVRNLTKDCCNELEKARAIFRWITVKNLNKMEFSDDLDPDTPLGLLRGIKLGIESYHVLFKRLCSYAGIHCEIIRGYSKGSGYKAGRKMSRRFRNSWTAVCVDGSWHFINCQWGARFTRGKHFEDELGQGQITSPGQGQGNVINEELQYRCEEFYFLTDPEDHIFEHFPDDKKWQLMEPAISMEEFIRLPVVKAPFFNKGLRFATRYISILWTHSGRAEVRIGVPNASRADFAAKIDPHHPPSAASRESGTGSVLSRRIDNEVLFTAKVPQPGIYFLKIFVADDPSTTMECACVFQINCTDVDKSSSRRHYPNVHILGATAHAKGLGISPVARFDPYVVHDKESDYCFRILTKRNCRISHTFVYFGKSVSSALENTQFAMIYEKDPDHVGFRLRMIKNGFYMLSVFAAELDLNVSQISVSQSAVEDQFECVYRVLVRCSVPSMEQCPLPIALGRWDVGVLHHPFTGVLDAGSLISFKLQVPGALQVSAMVNRKWQPLPSDGDTWDGTVYTGDCPGKLKLCAKYDESRGKYIPLFEYTVI